MQINYCIFIVLLLYCIPCDEWNSNFPVRPINQSQAIGFQVSRENTRSKGGLFHLCLLALGLLNDSEVKINDVLGEGDNIPFIVRIQKDSATTFTVPLYFPDEFKSHFRLTRELFSRVVMLVFHVAHMYFSTTH